MYDTSAKNTKVPGFLRTVTIIECVVVGAAAFALYLSPALAKNIWVWVVTPFNSRYMGAIYFAALLPLMVFAITARWSPGRVVLWMIFAFTTSIAVVMLFYIPQFAWDRLLTWVWWGLYVFLPFNSIIFLSKLRDLKVAGSEPTSRTTRNLIVAVTVLSGLYGIGLLLIPETMTSFWPWKIDAFHSRIYAATFLTPAVGAWIMRRTSAPAERLVLGLTLATLGILTILGTVWTSTTVPIEKQLNYSNLGTLAFLGMNAISALVGYALIRSSRKSRT